MATLIKSFSDHNWGITVVIFGILINLVSAYIKSIIDKTLGHIYPQMLKPFRRIIRRFEAEVASLCQSSGRQVMTQIPKTEFLVKFIGASVVAVLLDIMVLRVQSARLPHYVSILQIFGVLAGLYAAVCIGRYQHSAVTLARHGKPKGRARQIRDERERDG